jgi:hypothetical protein
MQHAAGSAVQIPQTAEAVTIRRSRCGVKLLSKGGGALATLLEAYEYAREVDRSAWDFAVRIDVLHKLGLTDNDLRWLVCKGLLASAREVFPAGDERSFRHRGPLTFSRRTCFILTESGADAARELTERAGIVVHPAAIAGDLAGPGVAGNGADTLSLVALTPVWDRLRQELRLGRAVVKRFKLPAVNQETVLAAFEEDGWPVHIDDPLPPRPDLDPKRRLHDTINSLNRNQKRPLIRFLGDGSGQGVRWELVESPPHESNGAAGP